MFRVCRVPPIFPHSIEFVHGSASLSYDVIGVHIPDAWLELGILLEEVIVDCRLQIIDAGIILGTNALCGDFGNEAFEEFHPERTPRVSARYA